MRGKGRLGDKEIDEIAREIRLALLEADVNFKVVKTFIGRVKEKATGAELSKSLSPAQQVIKIVHDELVTTLGGTTGKLAMNPKPPTVVMLVGLQGSGKTTASGKLARHLKSQGLQPLLVAADLQRPAAVTQLQVLGEQVGVPVYSEPTDPVAVARNARNEAARLGKNVIVLDTAGRLQIDEALMDELRRMRRGHPARQRPARGRRHDRPGGGERRRGFRRDGRHRRCGADQARRRRPGRCRALGQGGHRQADPLRRYRREARRLRGLPPRPDGGTDPRDGRRPHPDREGRGELRPGAGRESRHQAP